ncbi:MAG: 2Fe-2S ferredoxin-5 [Myxococcota bacterium]|nr:2Fe-2S ferredoxin-5 [Myxococcota bacterium]
MATVTIRWRRRKAAVEAHIGQKLLGVVLRSGFPLAHRCNGNAICGTCMVRVKSGMEHLNPPEDIEIYRLSGVRDGPNDRLACQARLVSEGDVSLFLPEVVEE